MKKKTLCGILTAAVILGTCPAAAFASESLQPLSASIDLREKEEDDHGPGWDWDAGNQILTLENFKMSVAYDKLQEKAVFYLPDESMLWLEGENELEVNSYSCDAFYVDGELNVTGDGELKVTTKSLSANVFYLKNGPLLIDGDIEITANAEGSVVYIDEAKGSRPIISIQDDAVLCFPKEKMHKRTLLFVLANKATPKDNWLDFDEASDDQDKMITLAAKKETADADKKEDVTVPPAAEETPADPEGSAVNEYQITIGKADITKNGEVSYTADVAPYLKNGYTMLPLRALLEVSYPEQKVNWNNGTKSAHTFVNNRLVSIKPGETTYTKALETLELYTPAETVNGRLFVSLRDWMNIMEIEDSQLKWDPETKTVTLIY